MRNAIRQRIIDDVPEFLDVVETHMADANTKKPFCMIQRTGDADETDWTGFRQMIEVWPLIDRTSYVEVDLLIERIKTALTRSPMVSEDGSIFTCVFEGAGADQIILEDFDAITRPMTFSVLSIQAIGDPDPGASDPWVEALAEWTRSLFTSPPWTVYTNKLEPGYALPLILWRLRNVESSPSASGFYELKKTIVGHVMGRSPNEQTEAGVRIVAMLQSARKIPLDAVNRRYLTVLSPSMNAESDRMTQGQLSVTLYRKENYPRFSYPL